MAEHGRWPTLTIGPIGSEMGTLEVDFNHDPPTVKRGCFTGTLVEFVRDFELLLVPNAGHWAMLDDPGLVTASVSRFVGRALAPRCR